MPQFYTINDNSFDKRGFPWLDKFTKTCTPGQGCPECGRRIRIYDQPGDMEATLEPKKGIRWPDAIGNGAGGPSLVVSERVLDDWRSDGITNVEVGGRVLLRPPYPKRLQEIEPPGYAWLDADRMIGAQLDLAASGVVAKGVCATCGYTRENVVATHIQRNERNTPYVLIQSSWDKASLFTTDHWRATFFCTDAVLECARKHRHLNFRFIPIEAGGASWSKGIDYLGKKWPVHHPLRQSEGKSLEEWLALLRDPSQRWEARCAILDFADEAATAVPVLLDILRESGDVPLCREVELVLSGLGKRGIALGPEGEEAARRHEEWFQSTLGRKET